MTSCASNGRAAAGKTTGMGARAVRRARERDDALARRTRAKERLPSVRARSNAGDSSRGRRRECVVYWDLDNATPPTDAEVRAFARRDREEASPRSHRLCFSFFFATRRCARFARLTSSPFFHHVNRGLNGRATATSTIRSSSNPRPWVEEFMRSRHSRHSRARVFAFAFFFFFFCLRLTFSPRRRCGRRDSNAWARRAPTRGVVAYANGKTLSRPNMRAALERVGVEIVEVGDVAEAADERLMTDVYSRARDAADAGALATVVVTCDARLRVCVEQARVRGVYTVVVSDFLRTWRSRPEFKHLLARFSAGPRARDDDDDEASRARCASSARVENSSKFKTRAFSRRGLAVGSTESARDDERRATFLRARARRRRRFRSTHRRARRHRRRTHRSRHHALAHRERVHRASRALEVRTVGTVCTLQCKV